jgi:hypothetical protein
MKRREFITLLGGAAAWPVAARAQQGGRMRRIGALMPYGGANDAQGQARNAAFLQGLVQLGWVVGRNLLIDYRWTTGHADDIRRNAAVRDWRPQPLLCRPAQRDSSAGPINRHFWTDCLRHSHYCGTITAGD